MSYQRAAAVVCDDPWCGQSVFSFDLHGARVSARAKGWHTGTSDLCPEHYREQTQEDQP